MARPKKSPPPIDPFAGLSERAGRLANVGLPRQHIIRSRRAEITEAQRRQDAIAHWCREMPPEFVEELTEWIREADGAEKSALGDPMKMCLYLGQREALERALDHFITWAGQEIGRAHV